MIDVHMRVTDDNQCEVSYSKSGSVCLNDFGLVVLELERMKQRILADAKDVDCDILIHK